jgi:hypothetical protein
MFSTILAIGLVVAFFLVLIRAIINRDPRSWDSNSYSNNPGNTTQSSRWSNWQNGNSYQSGVVFQDNSSAVTQCDPSPSAVADSSVGFTSLDSGNSCFSQDAAPDSGSASSCDCSSSDSSSTDSCSQQSDNQ